MKSLTSRYAYSNLVLDFFITLCESCTVNPTNISINQFICLSTDLSGLDGFKASSRSVTSRAADLLFLPLVQAAVNAAVDVKQKLYVVSVEVLVEVVVEEVIEAKNNLPCLKR